MGKEYIVKQGECLSSLAKRFGFVDYRTIYDHPANSELKKNRPNPNVIYPDDVVYIPDNELKEVDGATEQKHVFELKRPKTMFRLIVKDSDEKPFADVRYELKIDQETFAGTTDGEGKLEEEIPADARAADLVLFSEDGEEREIIGILPLKLGNLDPVEETSGVQARLNNLGFGDGKVSGVLDEKTADALRAFQIKYGLSVTGEADAATREKLRQIHDWQ
jgi:hypothetical protein